LSPAAACKRPGCNRSNNPLEFRGRTLKTGRKQKDMQLLNDDYGCDGWQGEMAQRVCAFDWSTTDLGPIQTWSKSLRATVQMVLASPVPLVMLWGKPGFMLYNDAYSVFAGGRHPHLLGSPVELGWPEIASFNRNVVDTCLAGGTLSYRDKELVLFRNGKPEEVWMDLSYSPVVEDDGAPAGVLAVVVETTERIVSERRRAIAEADFRRANERLQLALNSGAILGSFVWDIQANLLSGDERFARTFSYAVGDFDKGLPIEVATEIIHPDDVERVKTLIQRTVETGEPYKAEYRIRRADGTYLWILASGRCDFDGQGRPYRFPGVLIDIHERKVAEESLLQLTRTLEQRVADTLRARLAVEEQLRQSQKMEALGGLTGGVAHDFANVLQIISSNLQLLEMQEPDNPKLQRRVAAASAAVERGAKLSSQLLAFARRQSLSPAVVNPSRIFNELEDLLQRAMGETITVEMTLPEGAWNIRVDRNQLENAILNLAINGRDAMQRDGSIRIQAKNVLLSNDYCAGKDIAAGDYVKVSVADTGAGMTPEVLSRAFEPFFTTKAAGHGTGLGLSMVFGFVRQSGGHIDISSQVGSGTRVDMYFPRTTSQENTPAESERLRSLGGHETILVVEDDSDVRGSVVELLSHLGYATVQATNGDHALQLLESGLKFDLIFTDVVMPGTVKSPDLAAWARTQSPPVPVLFTSGHTRDMISENGVLAPHVHLLTKPYGRDALLNMLKKVLSEKSDTQR
jgi:PAS domain S-box-containing protein